MRRAKDPERYRAINRKAHHKAVAEGRIDKVKALARVQAYNKRHPKRVRAANRNYRRTHPEKVREYRRRYLAQRKAMGLNIW